MKTLLTRLGFVLLALAALYLIPVNLALNLPATRAYLNSIQPEQLAVTWERAWSLYPLRVELRGLAADGQTPAEQWQVDARRAAASVSLVPLLRGEIRVHDLDLADIDLRLRPRPQPGEEIQRDILDFFPVIRNRDPQATAEAAPESESGTLVLEVDDIHVTGEHAFWVSHIRGRLPGEIRGSFRMDAAAGELSLAGGAIDLALVSLEIGPEEPVQDAASVKGRIDIPPFRLAETEGLEFLRLPEVDAEIDLPVRSLDFLALLPPDLGALDLSGRGRLRGRLVLAGGEALPGTDLTVEARELAMDLGRYDFTGDGSVEVRVDPEDEAQADLIVRFDQVAAHLEAPAGAESDQTQRLFTGRGMTAKLHAAETDPTTTSTAERPEELLSEIDLALVLDIPSMEVADLAVYSRLLPDKWGVRLLGGAGTLSARMELDSDALLLDVDLASDEADMRYGDFRATTDMLLQLRAVVDAAAGATLHLDGTSLRIDDAEVDAASVDGPEATPWGAKLVIHDGTLTLPTPAATTPGTAGADPIPSVAAVLEEDGFGALLDRADGRLSATLTVTELDWIAELLGRPLDLTLKGSGELDADIRLADGWPEKGTTLTIPRESLSLALMEHRVDGRGEASLKVEKGGRRPRLRLDVALDDGRMRRRDEDEPSIGDVRMDADILATDPLADNKGAYDVALALHSARVRDMSTYNAYLPEDTPVSFLSGEASLLGDLRFAPDNAKGELLLLAKGIRIALDRDEVAGDLRLNLLLRDGSPEDMRFDITGSSLRLDGFQVIGESGSAAAPDWRARLQLKETEVLWRKPMHLSMRAGITVKDTRPFVAMLDNARGKHGWISDLLTVEDLGGHIELVVDGQRAVLADAVIGSEQVTVGAKGQAGADVREGMLYVRWGNLTGALAVEGDQRRFHAIGARDKFDAYDPVRTALVEAATSGESAKPNEDHGTGAAGEARAVSPSRLEDASRETDNLFLEGDS